MTKKTFFGIICITIFIGAAVYSYNQRSSITYPVHSVERFGDLTLKYCKAKWLAMKCNLKMLYRPFLYSDKLTLHRYEEHISSDLEKKYQAQKTIKTEDEILTYSEDVIKNILSFITPDANISIEKKNNRIYYHVKSENSAILIGKRGQTLDAIQYTVEKIVNKKS